MFSGGDLLYTLWAWVKVLIAAAIAGALVRTYLVPLWPYFLGSSVIALIGYGLVTWHRRTW